MGKGRKRKAEELKQKYKITIWLTLEEKEKLTSRAGQLPISSYFRETLLKGRSPKQPPIIPSINFKAYRELATHVKTLKKLADIFGSHTQNEQALALAKGSRQIKEALEQYRVTLISLKERQES